MVVDEAVVSRFKLTLNPLVPIADTFRTGCVFQQNNVVMGRGLVVVVVLEDSVQSGLDDRRGEGGEEGGVV